MYMNIYIQESRSTIGQLPILVEREGRKCTVHYCFGLYRYIRLVRFASYQLGPGPEMWDLGEISPPFLSLSL